MLWGHNVMVFRKDSWDCFLANRLLIGRPFHQPTKALLECHFTLPKPCDWLRSITLLLLCIILLEWRDSCWRPIHIFCAHRSESSHLNTKWLDIQWSEELIYRVMLLSRWKELSCWVKALPQWSRPDWWSSQFFTLWGSHCNLSFMWLNMEWNHGSVYRVIMVTWYTYRFSTQVFATLSNFYRNSLKAYGMCVNLQGVTTHLLGRYPYHWDSAVWQWSRPALAANIERSPMSSCSIVLWKKKCTQI
jgi:hypothetical protein